MDQIKKHLDSLKEFWAKQSKKSKTIILGVAGGVLLFSVIVLALLNMNAGTHVPLYVGLDPTESTQIYQMLKEMAVPVQIDSVGRILVPKDAKDDLLLELSALGYPKTALSYDIFTNNAGLTTTEFENKQYLLFQLQDRMEKTLIRIDGVQNAVVTLVVPAETSYVWQDTSRAEGSTSVLITMKAGRELSPTKVSAIKNLIASGVPGMKPENVTVVDALTSLEMRGEGDEADSVYSTNRLMFETEMEKIIVQKAMNVLSLGYAPGEMKVSATVVIDYDKMITEQLEYIPDEDGDGVVQHIDERYIMGPENLASGIVGEENNTDIPIYVDSNNDGIPDQVYYIRDVDYVISYIKRQIEKDETELVKTTIAISVRDNSLTEAKRDKITGLVSNATNTPAENITVADLLAPDIEKEPDTTPADSSLIIILEPYMPYIIAGVILLVVLLIIALVVMRALKGRKRGKKAVIGEEEIDLEAEELERSLQEAEAQKRKMRELAVASATRENAVTEEVREFAQENPEITASLIRAWLKEGD